VDDQQLATLGHVSSRSGKNRRRWVIGPSTVNDADLVAPAAANKMLNPQPRLT